MAVCCRQTDDVVQEHVIEPHFDGQAAAVLFAAKFWID